MGVVIALVLAIGVPAIAQMVLKTEAALNLGVIKKLQIKGTTPTESAGTGVIDVSSLVPSSSSDQVWTITGTTGTASATSISVSTATAGAKQASIKINYTGAGGTQQTGWLRVYDSAI